MVAAVLFAILSGKVLVSAGHEGRPASCARYPKRACNLGAAGERTWTPIVADEVTRVLRSHGVRVLRLPADFDGSYRVDAAVFIHFDGSTTPCASGASIGYHEQRFASAARAWRAAYRRYFPFGFQPDNFTSSLRDYYAYRQVKATDASMVLELGELTCPTQRAWLAPRLHSVADVLATYLLDLIGKGDEPSGSKTAPNAGSAHRRFR